jgi:hypothetical protein
MAKMRSQGYFLLSGKTVLAPPGPSAKVRQALARRFSAFPILRPFLAGVATKLATRS